MAFEWLTDESRAFLKRGYLRDGIEAEDRIREIADTAEELLGEDGFADKFYDYMSKGWISLASPVWSNFGLQRGFPISCFGSYIGDSMANIAYTHAENMMMSKYGGGTSLYIGALRERGAEIKDNGTSNGSVNFMQLFDRLIDVVSQGQVRRGTIAPYLPVEHGDIDEFLDIGTEGHPIQCMNSAVTVTNEWLQSMVDGDEDKRKIWAKVIQRRGEIGFPYIMFVDNANEGKPEIYKEKDRKIYASNVCSEIMLPSSETESFVCCLSSVNLLHYDEWKDTDLIEVMTRFLDAVLTDFINRLESMRDSDDPDDNQAFYFMERTYNFAKNHRAIGIGVFGWHSYLQSKMLAFDAPEAMKINAEVFTLLKERSYAESEKMAKKYGEPELLKGHGRRHTTTMAVAPTTSSAFIIGQASQSIEPFMSNCYVKDLAKMKITVKNKALQSLLAEKGKDDSDTWKSIRDNDGSVQHLDFLTDDEKAVFRTFAEIDQYVIIEQAAVRQMFIDQGQSLNVMIGPSTSAKEINNLYLTAWRKGIKALYYQHSMNAAQELTRKKVCESCEA